MFVLSRQYLFDADKAVQINQDILFIKGHNPNFDTKVQNRFINVDTRSSL